MDKDRKIRIGVIGCGGIANGKHMPAHKANPHSQLVAFCDIVEEKARPLCRLYGALCGSPCLETGSG